MNDHDKTKEQLIEEIADLRQRVAAFETGQKSAREDERLASLLRAVPLGVFECDTEGKITFANPSQEAITGMSAEELVGAYVWDEIEAGPQRDLAQAYFKEIILKQQQQPTPYLNRSTRKDGKVLDLRVDWNYRRNGRGELLGIVFGITDVSEQRRVEDALRQSEERYRNLADSTTTLISIMDRQGYVRYVNRATLQFLGCSVDDAVDKRQDELFPPEMCKLQANGIGRVFETGKPLEEDIVCQTDAGPIWLNTQIIPLRDEQGQVTAIMGISRNITDRKMAEAALKHAYDGLEQRIAERTAELVEAKREWERTFDSVPDLVAVLDRSSRIVRVNRAMADRLSLPPEECVGLHCCETVHGLKSPPEFCPNALTLGDGKGHSVEMHEDRLCGDFLVTTTPIFNDENELIGSVHVARDITERKQAQEALRQSEEKYRGFIDISPDSILVSDLNGTTQFVSKQTWKLLGLPEDTKLVGESTFDYLIEADRPRLAANMADLLRVGKRGCTEYTVLRPDGTTVPIELSSAVVRDAQGKPTATMAILRNVAERRQAQEALRQSEEKYRGLVEICPDAVVVTDLNAKTIFVSPQAWNLFGVSEQEELVGRSVFSFVVDEDRPRLTANIANLLAMGRQKYTEYTGVRPDGRMVPVELSSAVIRDAQGQPLAMMSIVRDISERKQAQESLRQSEEKYRGLIEICPDAVVVTDLTGKVVFVSGQAWKMLRVQEDVELVGRSVFEYIIESERPRMAAGIAELLATGAHKNSEYTGLRPDSSTIATEISTAVIRDAKGQPIALMAIIRDISDRKQAEETLRQSEEKYRGLVELCPDAVIVTNLAGEALFVSSQTSRMLGVPEEEDLTGQNIFDYVIETDRERLAANIADLYEVGSQKHMEYTVLRPDGITIPIEASSAVIRDANGEPMTIMAVLRDVSQRKRAEEELRQHYEELRAIYDGMADGLVILDIETTEPIRVNHSICKILGYSAEELKALPPDTLHPPEYLAIQREHYRNIIEERESHTEDVPFIRKDGGIVYAEITSDRITYHGRPCLIHFLRDTTERRLTQEALKKEHRTLKHLLQSSDHERQLIAYEIHDGLTQQLAGAIMQLDTFAYQKDRKPKDAAKAYDAAVTMLRQAHYEARRLISGVRPPILDESGIVAAVAHLVNEHRLQNGPKIEFRSEVSFDRLVPIMENAIYRIVQEGLANACKHSGSPRVRVELIQRDDVLWIKVKDWGTGFDPSSVKDDRFGLEGIRERARLLGGRTSFESAASDGTCITVELPLAIKEQ